jgi:hypothetical protein
MSWGKQEKKLFRRTGCWKYRGEQTMLLTSSRSPSEIELRLNKTGLGTFKDRFVAEGRKLKSRLTSHKFQLS